jgi:DHA1 family multidrug resistance protein-like MFS transporter
MQSASSHDPWRGQWHLEPWQRNLYAIVAAQTVAMIGFGIAQPFLPFYLQELGVETVDEVAFWVGLISSMQPIFMALSAPMWGLLADRYGRKPMLVRAMIGGSLTWGLAGLVGGPEQLAALRIMGGVFSGTVAAATTLVAVSTPRQHAGYSLGLLQTAIFSGNFLGPLVGGIIGSTLGYRAAFVLSGILLGAMGALVAVIVKETFVHPAPRQSKGNPVLEPLRSLAANRLLLTMVLLLMLHHMSVNVTSPVLPLYVQSLAPDLKQASAATGVIIGATALANALSSVWVGRSADRLGRRRVLIICLVMGALSYLPQGLTRRPWQLLALRVLTGFSMGGVTPTTNAAIAEAAPEGRQGGVYGMSASLNALGRAMGPVLGTIVVTNWSVAGVFPVTGFLLLAAAVFAALRTRSMAESRR